MEMKKTDRRVKYTRMVIKDSLISLMKHKPITKITIKAICEKADVNRSTFYAHFNDQFDLLQQIQNEILQEIGAMLTNFNYKENKSEAFQMMEKIFDYIIDNSAVCEVLLGEQGDIAFQKAVIMLAQHQQALNWKSEKHLEAATAEYLYLYTVNGSLGIVQSWLKNGMQESSKEMADLILQLTNKGLAAFI